jgi:16S rRNA (guanine527-N7)-methyltransferase
VPDCAAPLPDHLRPIALAMFGPRLDRAEAYADQLATDGVVRGLIGPREAPRIWDRHILNCAAMAELISEDNFTIDVGSGAGLPGIVLALMYPELKITLVDSLARRTAFLDEVVSDLDLGSQVSVVRARAEEVASQPALFHVKPADVVTARAVAPLDRLVGWCLPLLTVGGRLLAMKGSSAADEVTEHAAAIARMGGSAPQIHRCAVAGMDPTLVVEVVRQRVQPPPSATRQRSASRSRRG